jgi:preprotein translocase subunit SecA
LLGSDTEESLVATHAFNRCFAGPGFQRAHVIRDERLLINESSFESFLQDQYAWISRKKFGRNKVESFLAKLRAANLDLASLSDNNLKCEFRSVVERTKLGQRSDTAQARALACVGEVCQRVLGKYPYGVQFFAALQLTRGQLIEMQTGEGKSLVAAIAACVMAAAGAKVHVVSVNDYLSKRDGAEMRPLFSFLDLTSSFVCDGMERNERFHAYRCSICYVSGSELVFDDLKDRMSGLGRTLESLSQFRSFIYDLPDPIGDTNVAHAQITELPLIPSMHFAIIDEADSVLIDEARTPMILSKSVDASVDGDLWTWAITQSRKLERNKHFRILEERTIELLEAAMPCIEVFDGKTSHIWRTAASRKYLIMQALSALHLFVKDQHYIVADEKIFIVDESTGRLMPDRAWEQGLHQLIEVKEGVPATDGRETFARMTFQRFFRHYYLVSGLSGTISETSRELWLVYRLRVICLPPHRPNRRHLSKSICCTSAALKWQLVAEEVMRRSKMGQPVLVGTRSVQASEDVSAVLNQMGLEHVVLNARQNQDEAAVVAMAGRSGQITVATNMAGRGTDIKLDEQAMSSGGLHVILTEYHESARVDRQLFGRAGRQGDPGSGVAIVSSEDNLFRRYTPVLNRIWANLASPGLKRAMMEFVRRIAQRKAESIYKDSRLQTLKQDRNLQSIIGLSGKRL